MTPEPRYAWKENVPWQFAATVDPHGLGKAFEPVAEIVDEAKVTIGPKGVHVVAADPANCAMVETSVDCVKSADGTVSAGVHISDTVDNWPGYYPKHDDYKVEITHSEEGHRFTVDNGPEGQHKTTAFRPESTRTANWPEVEEGHQNEFELPTPKVRGVLGALADAADDVLRLTPGDGQLMVDAIEGESIEQSWLLEADVSRGKSQYYSTDYLRKIISEFWADGYTTVCFGKDQPLTLENSGIRAAQAPRPYDMVEIEDVEKEDMAKA